MAVEPTLIITDGNGNEVSLVRVTPDAVMSPRMGGFGSSSVLPQQRDRDLASIEQLAYTENYRILVKECTIDQIAIETRKLFELLRKAWLYSNKADRYTTPIYLQVRARKETNVRYALVLESPDIVGPFPIFDLALEQAMILDDVGITIQRTIWSTNPQGDLPDASTLQPTNGPAAPAIVAVSNFYDDHGIDQVKVDDGGAFTDHFGVAAFNLFPAAAVTNDRLYIGSDEPFFHFMGYIGTPGVYTSTTFAYEYWNGAWTPLVLGDEFTIYPDTDPFNQIGHWGFNWKGKTDWAKTAIDGDTKFWIRVVVTMGGVWTTAPANAVYAIYNQRTPQIRIPAGSLKGDAPPTVLLRSRYPAGGDEDVYFSNTSRIIIGAKSRNLASFSSHLNCGGDGVPAGWAVAYGDDTASIAYEVAPGGDVAECSFGGTSTWAMRVRFTGTDMLDAYAGKYRPFLRVHQAGGDPGDVNVKLRVYINDNNDYDTLFELPEQGLKGTVAAGGVMEIVDLYPQDRLSLPFASLKDADDLSSGDLIFEVWAEEVNTGTDLMMYDLILIPADEWIVELDDPISGPDAGNSALRGLCALDFDGGVIDNRTIKYVLEEADLLNAETWSRHGHPPRLNPYEGDHRLYVLMGHYPEGEDWGDPPLCGRLGMMFTAEIFQHTNYHYLRGDD